MQFHEQWNTNIIHCESDKRTCKVYQKLNKELGGTCADFCQGFDLKCIGGWTDLSDYKCQQGEQIGCENTDGITSDHICECGVPDCGSNCQICNPIATPIIPDTPCIEILQIPQFFNAPSPEWALGLISQACQSCVYKKDFTCKNAPWVPNGNACIQHAVNSCKQQCYDIEGRPEFPKSSFTSTEEDICLTPSGTLGECGPANVMSISPPLPNGVVTIKHNGVCLSSAILSSAITFENCLHQPRKKECKEWFLETVV